MTIQNLGGGVEGGEGSAGNALYVQDAPPSSRGVGGGKGSAGNASLCAGCAPLILHLLPTDILKLLVLSWALIQPVEASICVARYATPAEVSFIIEVSIDDVIDAASNAA